MAQTRGLALRGRRSHRARPTAAPPSEAGALADRTRRAAVPSPFRLFLSVLAIVFLAEAVVMLLLPHLAPAGAHRWAPFIDAAVLVLLSAPLLWWLVARPLQAALAAREAALAANEALLHEVHHRVKNNLQMLCDMLFLQMEGLADEAKSGELKEIYGRLYAIARLHEQLYQSMQSGQVQLPGYLCRLVTGFASLYPAAPIVLDVPEADLALDTDRAIHVGLIVNELVTNALKHAFPQRQGGRVDVRVRRHGDRLELQVRDNGVGLPANLDVGQARSLGLRIVHLLTSRLGGSLRAETRDGACFTVLFPLQGEAAGSADRRAS